MQTETAVPSAANIRAFSVHVLTASGAALGFLALLAAIDRNWPLMFLWLGVAAIVDGIDGTFARRWQVAERIPRWSGDTLDLVVDYVTYVLVPTYALVAGGLMPRFVALLLGFVILVTSAIYFADTRMKTETNDFRGFPATWNVVAFYLFLLRPEPWITAFIVMLFAGLTFVPITFVHPFRTRRMRNVSLMLLAAWALLAGLSLWQQLAPGLFVTAGLCLIALYFLAAGLYRRPA
jgi:phosphatidylcholine synthase